VGACGADCGITRVRAREKDLAFALAERVHRDRVWSRAAERSPALSFDAMVSLGQHLEELLPVRAIVRAFDRGGPDAIDLLAGLHAPALLEIADGARAPSSASIPSRETYLRIAISPFGRLATIQEVRVEAKRIDPPRSDGRVGLEIVEEPCAGVEDPRLRAMVKGLQGALRKAGLTLLDMAFLVAPVLGSAQVEFVRDFGEAPALWSLLFDAAPPTTIRASLATLNG